MAMSHAATPQFALPRADNSAQSRYARLSGKLSRFLARNVATKKLPMTNSRPLVTFTFDDAPASACTTGALLLEQYHARGTYYISGGGCGAVGYCGPLATTTQVKALCLRGHEIGCHTYSHTDVASVGYDALAAELDRNRSFLQSIHRNMMVRNFAYPYGELSFGAKRYLEARFDSCRSLEPGVNIGAADLGALRTCALENASINRQGIAEIFAETVRGNGWLVFASHDVDNEPSRFGVSAELLEFALNAARAAGCQLVTVQEALQIFNDAVVRPGNDERG